MPKSSLLAIGLGLLLAGCASHPRSPQPSPDTRPVATSPSEATVVLTAGQIDLIRSYYGSAAHGRGRGKGLPPGIAKNLQRGKPLPPGLARQPLPGELYARLPRPPAGFEYIVVAGKLLLVEIATQLVRQILLETVFG